MIHQVQKPNLRQFEFDSISDLGTNDLDKIAASGVDEAWYWYVAGGYEGAGHILYRSGGMWDYHSLSHCSCYGPLECFDPKPRYPSLDALLELCTQDLRDELAPCIEAARKDGGGA